MKDKKSKNEYNKKYHKKNKKSSNEASRQYTKDNKETISSQKKSYYQKNKKSIIDKSKKHYELNKELIQKKRRKYRLANKEKIAKQKKEYQQRLHKTVLGKLAHNIRQAIRRSLISKGYNKKFTSEKILGCSIVDFKIYLESKWEPWMNWDNKGLYNGQLNYGWDIDHIIPLYTAKTEEEIIRLCHFTNLSPLCSKINRDIKKNKI